MDPLGHVAEIVLLLALGEITNFGQVGIRVGRVVGLVVGGPVVGGGRVTGQERHQLARVGTLGPLAGFHQPGEVDDVLLARHVVGADIFALVLGDIKEHLRVAGVVDDHVRGQPLRAVLQRVGVPHVGGREHHVA